MEKEIRDSYLDKGRTGIYDLTRFPEQDADLQDSLREPGKGREVGEYPWEIYNPKT